MADDALRGTLFCIVGPSGAGKDSLIDAARAHFTGNARLVFPAREITRPVAAGGEAHVAVTRQDFAARRAASGYALSWEANGQCYGIGRAIEADLAAGRHVVCNVSRGVIDSARQRYQPVKTVLVTAPLAVLAARIATRGRETAAEVKARLARAQYPVPSGADVWTIVNDGVLGDAVAALVAVLMAADSCPPKETGPAN